MHRTHRFEDLLPDWRTVCEERVSNAAIKLTSEAATSLPAHVDPGDSTQQLALSETVTREVTRLAVEDLLPSCVGWLAQQQLLPPEPALDRVHAEAAVALRQRLPAFQAYLPPPTARIPYGSWAFPAAAGAALGCLALSPLSLLLFDQREAGLLVGGIAGAGIAVGLLAWVSERPKMLGCLQNLAGAASLFAALRAAVALFRAKSTRPLTAAAWVTGCWVLLLLVRPRLTGPVRDECRDALRPQVERHLAHAADLVLALCWSHPNRRGAGDKRRADGPPIPEPVADALGMLRVVSEDENAPDRHLRNAIRALLQRVREGGYEWQAVPDGTPYDASLAEHFACFGLIEVGQPVEMLEPARIWNGKPDKPGQLRAM
ncbi:MAG: hypothetical protein JWO38_6988 [Gemmataceae bacterium]|nr:hypothetical protein [Gemmataceae bacterium]